MIELSRVKKITKWLVFNDFAENDTDLAKKLGYTKSFLSQILNGKTPISEKFIKSLCDADPNINKVWILTGEGNMLINEKNKEQSAQNVVLKAGSRNKDNTILVGNQTKNDFSYLLDIIKEKDNQIAKLHEQMGKLVDTINNLSNK